MKNIGNEINLNKHRKEIIKKNIGFNECNQRKISNRTQAIWPRTEQHRSQRKGLHRHTTR